MSRAIPTLQDVNSIFSRGLPDPLVLDPSLNGPEENSGPSFKNDRLKVKGGNFSAIMTSLKCCYVAPVAHHRRLNCGDSPVSGMIEATASELCSTFRVPAIIVSGISEDDLSPCVNIRDSLSEQLMTSVIVKQPGSQAFGPASHQQASLRLAKLRTDHGVVSPIVAISTYNHWQFCWHNYASLVASADSPTKVQSFRSHDPISTDFDTLCVSPVFSCQDPELPMLIASLILKAADTRREPAKLHWVFSASKMDIKFPALDPSSIDIHRMVSADAEEFYLVKFLRHDAYGRIYLMATADGACCAIKLFSTVVRGMTPAKACFIECSAWNLAYGKNCGVRAATVGGWDALIMPYYETISAAEWVDSRTWPLVVQHWEEIVQSGARRSFARPHVVWANAAKSAVRLIDWTASTVTSDVIDVESFSFPSDGNSLRDFLNGMPLNSRSISTVRDAEIVPETAENAGRFFILHRDPVTGAMRQ